MTHTPPSNSDENEARAALIVLARAMLAGSLTFVEGSVRALRLRGRIGGVHDDDEDFAAFELVSSETDHLPLAAARELWHPDTHERLDAEVERTHQWAATFVPAACQNILNRFDRT